MAEEFVYNIKFKADDSDVDRSLSKIERRFGELEKRAGNIQIKLKTDLSAQRLASSLSRGFSTGAGASGLSSLVREQRHAAKSANALAVAFDSVRRAVELFSLRLAKVNVAGAGTAMRAGAVAVGGSEDKIPFGRLGRMAMVMPGLTQMAQMAYQPLKMFALNSVNAFNTQNRAEKLLEFGMLRNGTADRVQELKDYASDIQRRTIYGDEAMLTAAGGWQNRIKDVNNSKRMMELVADFAAKTTGGGEVSAEQMRGFSQQLMQALSGRAVTLKAQGYDISAIEQLQKYRQAGGNVTENMEVAALEKVLSSVKGAAEELANTDEGKIIQTKNAMGDLREEVGKRLQPVFARISASIMANMPTIGRMFDSFGNIVERVVQVIADNSGIIASFAEKAVGLLEILSQFPGPLLAFGAAAKVASAAIGMGGVDGGLLSSISGLGGSLMKLGTSTAWGLLFAELALLGTTVYQAYKQISEQNKANKEYTEKGNARVSLSKSVARLKRGEITESQYKSAYDAALRIDSTIADSERFNIWKKPEAKKPSATDFDKQWAAMLKNMKPVTNNKITVNNEIKTDSEMTAKIIKDQLRELTTSRLNFTSRTAAAKALAI